MNEPRPSARRSPECVSDLVLDRLLAGELTGASAQAVRAHLSGCALCEARHAVLAADREAFAAGGPQLGALIDAPAPARTGRTLVAGSRGPSSSPASRGAASVGAPGRARSGKRRVVPRVWAGLSLAAAAAVALGVGLRGLDRGESAASGEAPAPGEHRATSEAPVANGVRTKGSGVALGFIVRRAGVTRDGQAGDVLHPGDGLRFTLGASQAGYAGVWNLDAAGRASALLDGDALFPVAAEQRQVLPGAVELDDSLGDERLVAVLCERQLPKAEVQAALVASPAPLRLPSGCSSDSVPIRKERP